MKTRQSLKGKRQSRWSIEIRASRLRENKAAARLAGYCDRCACCGGFGSMRVTELTTFQHFITTFLSLLVAMAVFLGWWLISRRTSIKEGCWCCSRSRFCAPAARRLPIRRCAA